MKSKKLIKVYLIHAFILSISLCSFAKATQSINNSFPERADSPDYTYYDTLNYAVRHLIGLTIPNTSYKDFDHPCDDQSNIEEANLCQQWRNAESARSVANDSKFQIGLNFAAVALNTLTVVISLIAVFLTWKSVEVTRNNSEAQLKAYLTTKNPHISSFDENTPCNVELTPVNTGQTPARLNHITIYVRALKDKHEISYDHEYNKASFDVYAYITHADSVNIRAGDFIFSKDDILRLQNRDLYIFVYGYIDYRDVFNTDRKYHFAHILNMSDEFVEKITSNSPDQFEVRWEYINPNNGEF